MQDLNGKVAVVTGAGAGIGRATALALARAGMEVAVSDLHEGAAKETVDAVVQAGGQASAHTADVSSESEMRRLVDAVIAAHGVVDVVVNNAGVGVAPTETTQVSLDTFHRVMDVNFWGVVHGSLLFLPHLLGRSAANLVNLASNAALIGYPRMAPYTSSKFAVRGFTETLRMELRPTPVRVTLVCPGATKTNLLANSPLIDEQKRNTMQRQFDRTALRSPDTVAAAVVRGIRHDRPRVLVGPDTAAMDWITRLAPGLHSRLLAAPVNRFMAKNVG